MISLLAACCASKQGPKAAHDLLPEASNPPLDSPTPMNTTSSPCTAPQFTLDVYEKHLGVVYQYPDLLDMMAEFPSNIAIRLDETDIIRIEMGYSCSSLIALHLSSSAAEAWNQRIGARSDTDTQGFTVNVCGKRLFAGVIYTYMGAAAIQTPVLYRINRAPTILYIASSLGVMKSDCDEEFSRIDRPELRDLFRRRGILEEVPSLSVGIQ